MNILLLRGLTREHRHWLEFTDLLSQAGLRPWCLDLPGFGDEKHKTCPLTIAGNTDDLRWRWGALKAQTEGPWCILGLSMGAMISLDWCCRFKDDFVSAIIINTSSRDSGEILHRFSLFAIYQTLRILTKKTPRQKEEQILKLISNLRSQDKNVLLQFEKIAAENPVALISTARQLMASSRFMSPSKIEIPLLVLASIKDHLVDVRCSKYLAEKYHAQIKFHPSAGHDLPLDDGPWCVNRIQDFLATTQQKQTSFLPHSTQ